MNVQERQARFAGSVVLATLAVLLVLIWVFGLSPAVMAGFALLGLSGFTNLIVRKERKAGKIVMDERDLEIARTATVIAYSVFWVCFVIAAMAPFFVLGPNASLALPTPVFTGAIWVAWCIVLGVRSLVILILYRRGRHGQES